MDAIILAQTDTTVGFLSQNARRLEEIKRREGNKPFLKVYADLRAIRRDIRIPFRHKHRVRHSTKTTFVVKNQAFRYVRDPHHAALIRPYGWLYSTSANESGKRYDYDFCFRVCDIVVEDQRGLSEQNPSRIFRLTPTKLTPLR
jgi:tRNA A37 threonylcarbamoyladenosine synthetase subunit TsaC/SUA5/YrdC